MRRWVRYEAPIMVCVDLDDNGYEGDVVAVVLAEEHEDLSLARDHRGHFLVYDETMQRIEHTDDPAEVRAINIAEHHDWPARLDWEEGPDALRYPGLYDPVDAEEADEDCRDARTTARSSASNLAQIDLTRTGARSDAGAAACPRQMSTVSSGGKVP